QLLVGGDGEPVKADDVGEFISIIVEEVNRLNKVVSQFLDYARPYKGEPAEVDVNEVVRKTMQILEAHEHPQKVKLDVRLSAELPRVRGDAEQLRQVFLNLGLNGVEPMPDRGTLTTTTPPPRPHPPRHNPP